MFRPSSPEASQRRRAVILMVVLVLLTLFAIVGLAFVLYANNEANASRIYREAQSTQSNVIDIDANILANTALGQLIFDVPDITSAATASFTAIRGHSLSRDIYGWNSDAGPTYGTNIYPFNGVGHLHSTNGNNWGMDDHALISYVPYPADNFIRDPERIGKRGGFGAALPSYTGGWHSSYTYPDGNHVYLGAFDADGNVLARSFARPYLVPNSSVTGTPYLPLNPSDPNYWSWFTDVNPNNAGENVQPLHLRYFSLRPRNADMAVGFPPPGLGGDVKNLQGFPGANDSVWVDLDYPVQTAADGTQFKPLFAFFIADLDGRVNINTHGNVRSTTRTHLSNQGWGKWEVNPAWLSGGNGATTPGEWPQLFVGSGAAPTVPGRYGADKQPNNSGVVAPPGALARVISQADFDGSDDSAVGPPANVGGVATGPIVLPGNAASPAFSSFPFFPAGYNNGFAAERTNHPLNYDSQWPGGDDRRFNANIHALEWYNGGPTSTAALGTDLGKLLPNTVGVSSPTGFRVRNMTTFDSAALDVPGLTPWIYNRTSPTPPGTAYGYGGALGANAHQPPNGAATAFPALNLRGAALPASTEFTVDWKSADAVIGKVDLNRFLSPYPHLGQGTTAATYVSTPMVNPYDRFDQNVANGPAILAQYKQAQADRQQLADDIYRRLLRVTSVPAVVAPATPTVTELAARRWLAQLAVNIVDFIDEDEISTPFNFYNTTDGLNAANIGDLNNNPNTNNPEPEMPKYWVFGTELPKIVLNEVLAEYQTPIDKVTGKPATGQPFPVRVFAELFNPMPSAAQLGGTFPATVQQQDNPTNPIQLYIAASGANPAYSPYNVVLADTHPAGGQTSGLLPATTSPTPNNDNVMGTPNTARAAPVDADFGNKAAIQTIDSKPATATIAPQQYFLLSPGGTDANGTFATVPVAPAKGNGVVPAGTTVLTSSNMQYNVQLNATGTQWQLPVGNVNITDGVVPVGTTSTGVTVLLRRLANPHLPPDMNPVSPTYNPYLTIDYMRGVPPKDGNNGAINTSTAKAQPYASNPRTYLTQNPAAGVNPPATVDTFGSPNSAATFNWLVHLDRQLISPMELLNVSGYHPYELTTRFMAPNSGGGAAAPIVPYNHRVNWYNEATRLYRAFEYLGTRDRDSGVSALGGRQPGKININSIWNAEILRALADPQTGNGYAQADVDAAFAQMIKLRSPGYTPGPGGLVGGTDRPFLGMGIGVMPSVANDPVSVLDNGTVKPNSTNTGIEDTFLRSFDGKGGTQRLFDVSTATHPYQTTEMMRKIFGNVTNRSNTFAVWVTVGFFRVPSPVQHVDGLATGPVKVAEEIGASTGTNIRHRLFSVVDRTRLTIARRMVTTLTAAVPQASLNQPTGVTVALASGTTGLNVIPWKIQVGSTLIIDSGTASEETVIVQQITGTTITATFSKAHAAGATVQIPGNPGPQSTWTVASRGYAGLLLTYTVMQ